MILGVAGFAFSVLWCLTMFSWGSDAPPAPEIQGPEAPAAPLPRALAPVVPPAAPARVRMNAPSGRGREGFAPPPSLPLVEERSERAPSPSWQGANKHRLLHRELLDGLSASRSLLASCPGSRIGGGSAGRQGEDHRSGTPPVLVVEVARFDGRMEILDVPSTRHGSSSEAFLACARRVLRGQVIPSQSATAGGPVRFTLPLHSAGSANRG